MKDELCFIAPGIGRAEYEQRINRLQMCMEQKKVDAVALFYPTDIFYFSGVGFCSIMLIPFQGQPVLLVQINASRAQKESWLDDVRPSKGISTFVEMVTEFGLQKATLGLELDVLPVNVFQHLQDTLPLARLVDFSPEILAVRMIKSPAEVAIIRQAAKISEQGFLRCAEVLREGITELEVHEEIRRAEHLYGTEESMVLRAWNRVLDFGMVSSGPNTYEISGYWLIAIGRGLSLARPYGPSRRRIQKGEFVCVNKGVNYSGYHVDESRTFIIGEPTPEQQRCYDAVRKIQEDAFAAVKPGVPVKKVYAAAKRTAGEEGYEKYFMARAVYDVEYLGHGVGLEIDEPPLVGPRTDLLIQEGMVFAFEPKIIIPGWGGVDIEDTLAVTSDGMEVLTRTDRKLWVV